MSEAIQEEQPFKEYTRKKYMHKVVEGRDFMCNECGEYVQLVDCECAGLGRGCKSKETCQDYEVHKNGQKENKECNS